LPTAAGLARRELSWHIGCAFAKRREVEMSCGRLTPAYPVGELLGFATALFQHAGLDSDKAGTVAEILVEGDLLGHTTHGLALAAPYLAALDAGSMTPKGDPAVISDRGGAVCWGGRRLPGPWLVVRAIEQALARVPEHGVVAVAIRESHHIGCLAAYLERATSQGCMILLTCSDPSEASVAPYGECRPCSPPTLSRSGSRPMATRF